MSFIRTNYVSIPLTVMSNKVERVPYRSGLNWGQRPGRNPNQAYLKVPSIEQQSGFFPKKGINLIPSITVHMIALTQMLVHSFNASLICSAISSEFINFSGSSWFIEC